MNNKTLKILNGEFTIHRFDPSEVIPTQLFASEFFWIGKTDTELSVVCSSAIELGSTKSETGWKTIRVLGQIDFSAIGVIAGITSVLADKGISVYVVSTFETDYVLVKTQMLAGAIEALTESEYIFED